MIEHYQLKGWVRLPNYVSSRHIDMIHEEGMRLRLDWQKYSEWRGIPWASKYSEVLDCFYRSNILRPIAQTVLGVDVPYLFNDEIVMKLPNDEFDFHLHTDNEHGGNKNNAVHVVNCMVVLDDFNENNGPLVVINKDNGRHVTVLANRGDVIAMNGSTYHYSGKNTTDSPRGQYSCSYAAEKLVVSNFYSDKFEEVCDFDKIS